MASFGEELAKVVNDIVGRPRPVAPTVKAPTEPAPEKQRPGGGASKPTGLMPKYIKNLSVGLKDTQPVVHQYLELLAHLMAEKFPDETLYITSGKRSPAKQVSIMISNWKRNGGDTPISSENPVVQKKGLTPEERKANKGGIKRTGPYTFHRGGKEHTIETLGDHDTVGVYGPWLGLRFSKSMEKGEIGGKPPETYWTEWYDKRFVQHKEEGKASHGSGLAIDFAPKSFVPKLIEMSKRYADAGYQDETDRDGPHYHVWVKSVRSMPDKKLVASLSKKAFVSIEPYQSFVKETVDAIKSKRPGYFTLSSGQEVSNFILEQGSPGHFGMVRSDDPSTIYISFQKIQNAVAGAANVQAMKAALCEVITHEMGHIKSNFQGGEAPAEKEEADMRSVCEEIAREASAGYNLVVQSAQELGGKEEQMIIKGIGIKTAFVNPEMDPNDLAQSILRIMYHFAQKVNPENQSSYLQNLKNKFYTNIDPITLSGKKRNPGAGVGASISIIKNILSGEDPHVVQRALQIVYEGLDKL